MFLRGWRLLTIMLAALSMGTALGHLLEMPAKLRYDGPFWLGLLQTLYPPGFGTAGSAFEGGAVLSVVVLVFLVRDSRRAFAWTLAGAVCIVVAHAAFWALVAPVNAELLPLSGDTLPAHWTELRARWEYTHAARAFLQIAGLAFLVYSVLVTEPSGRNGKWESTPEETRHL